MASVSGSVESESMVSIDESKIRGHVDEVARTSVEETLSGSSAAMQDIATKGSSQPRDRRFQNHPATGGRLAITCILTIHLGACSNA